MMRPLKQIVVVVVVTLRKVLGEEKDDFERDHLEPPQIWLQESHVETVGLRF